MSDDPQAPDSLENVNAIEVSQEIKDFVTGLASDVEEALQDRSEWEGRQDEYTRKRYGLRTKRSFPWVGAANFVLPQIDSDINRLKPAYVNLAFGVSPICTFEPFGPEDIEPARKRELLFDWRMKTQVKPFKEYCVGVDYMLQRGFTLFKTFWKFETRTYTQYLDLADLDQEVLDALFMPEVTDDLLFQVIVEQMKPDLSFQENVDEIKRVITEFREGKSKFEMEFIEKAANHAVMKACDPRQDVTFPIGTTDIQDARFIDYRYWISKNDLKKAMKSGQYESYEDNDIDSWATKSSQISTADYLKAVRDGVTQQKKHEDLILMHEVCTWYDVNGDGIEERVIVNYPDTNPAVVLRFIENPYDHGMFPYDVVCRELNDAEIMSSRGIPALDDDFQTGISTLFNQDIDAGTIMNTPTVVARRNSVKNLRNLRYVPGQVVETENGTADYTVVQNQNLGQGNRFNSMQYLKAWANDRIGNVTSATSQINNTPGRGPQGAKTATEVSEISSASGQLQSYDLLVFQNQMAGVYGKLDALYEQFGDEEEYVMITNEEPIKVSRREVQCKFSVVPNGRLDNSNPVLRANKTLALYDRFIQNPFVKAYELTKLALNDLDMKASKLIMLTQQEVEANRKQQIEAQLVEEHSKLQEQLGVRKLSDAMEIEKERKLAIIQGRKYSDDETVPSMEAVRR